MNRTDNLELKSTFELYNLMSIGASYNINDMSPRQASILSEISSAIAHENKIKTEMRRMR